MHQEIFFKYSITETEDIGTEEKKEEGKEVEYLIPVALQDITCLLSKKVFENPVVANDGYTYDKEALIAYINKCEQEQVPAVSPKDPEVTLVKDHLIVNFCLKSIIPNFNDKLPPIIKESENPFIDPVTKELMTSPIICNDEMTFDRTTMIDYRASLLTLENGILYFPDCQRSPLNRKPITNWRTHEHIQDIIYRFLNKNSSFTRFLPKRFNSFELLKEIINKRDAKKLYSAITFGASSTIALLLSAEAGYTSGVNIALMKNADIDYKNDQGLTALYMACQNGHDHIVELLINEGANCTRSVGGLLPLHVAAMHNQFKVVSKLLSLGADYDSLSYTNYTAIHYAVGNDSLDSLILLRRDENDDLLVNSQGITPLHVAVIGEQYRIVEWLLKYGSKKPLYILSNGNHNSPLMSAIYAKSPALVKLLLPYYSKEMLEVKNVADYTPLLLSILLDCPEIAIQLIEAGSPLEARHQGATALIWAAEKGMFQLVEALIDKGANIHAATIPSEQTALFKACVGGYEDIASLLIKKGADVNQLAYALAPDWNSPLIIEGDINDKEYYQVSPTKKNIYPLMPIFMAAKSHHLGVLKLLLNAGSYTSFYRGQFKVANCIRDEPGCIQAAKILDSHDNRIYRKSALNEYFLKSIPFVAFCMSLFLKDLYSHFEDKLSYLTLGEIAINVWVAIITVGLTATNYLLSVFFNYLDIEIINRNQSLAEKNNRWVERLNHYRTELSQEINSSYYYHQETAVLTVKDSLNQTNDILPDMFKLCEAVKQHRRKIDPLAEMPQSLKIVQPRLFEV